jgi:hypothetical protein
MSKQSAARRQNGHPAPSETEHAAGVSLADMVVTYPSPWGSDGRRQECTVTGTELIARIQARDALDRDMPERDHIYLLLNGLAATLGEYGFEATGHTVAVPIETLNLADRLLRDCVIRLQYMDPDSAPTNYCLQRAADPGAKPAPETSGA